MQKITALTIVLSVLFAFVTYAQYGPPATNHSFDSIWHAAARGTAQDVQGFIDRGTKINASDKDGLTPLHVAAYHENVEVVKFLVFTGADVKSRSKNGWTPLHSAVDGGKVRVNCRNEIVDILLSKGANLHAKNTPSRNGYSPFDMMKEHEFVQWAFELLLNHDEKTERIPTASSTPSPTVNRPNTTSTASAPKPEKQPVRCSSCNGSGTKTTQCKGCDGTGLRPVDCRSCQGMGRIVDTGRTSNPPKVFYKTCDWCKGMGRTQCTNCTGAGTKTERCYGCGGTGYK